MKYEAVIGLEIHVQLKTKSKMFCTCSNAGENEPANTTICPICVGHPGTLPVINHQAILWGIKASLALNCKVASFTKFDRKNYFYPDLPKGYQISQFDKPLAKEGYLIINKTSDGMAGALDKEEELKKVRLNRLHMEEDAAKNFHSTDGKSTLVDYNRGGTPLMEIVTEPDFNTPEEAKTFLQELRLIMRYLDVSSADMEKGHLRCDANISLRPKGSPELFPKTEIKNLNSFKAVERALKYEINRQSVLWDKGTPPKVSSTRGWNENKQVTEGQREKEAEHDYRYFAEPDLPPLTFGKDEILAIKATLTELPQDKRRRFVDEYGFSYEEAKILTDDKDLAAYTEKVISELSEWLEALEPGRQKPFKNNRQKLLKLVSSWLINRLADYMQKEHTSVAELKVTAENFAELMSLLFENKINSTAAQKILKQMVEQGGDPSQIMKEQNLEQMNDSSELEKVIEKIIKNNPDQVQEYLAGKEAIIKYLMGQVMKETQGKADPMVAEALFKEKIKPSSRP